MKTIRIGTRDNALATVQAEIAATLIKRYDPSITIQILPIKTSRDIYRDQMPEDLIEKDMYIKELDQELLDHNVDICVHSLKDLPYEITQGLTIAAVSKRTDARDAIVFPKDSNQPHANRPIGTSSSRIKIQLQVIYPDFWIEPIQGDIFTQLEKLDRGEYGALVLAVTELKQLGMQVTRNYKTFSAQQMIPAAGQGIIAITARVGETFPYLSLFHDSESWDIMRCERAFVRTLEGGYTSPVTAYAQTMGDRMVVSGYAIDKQMQMVHGKFYGKREKAISLGVGLGAYLMQEAEERE